MIISLCIFRFNLFEFRIVWISFFFYMDTAQVLPCKVIFYIGINSLKKGYLVVLGPYIFLVVYNKSICLMAYCNLAQLWN